MEWDEEHAIVDNWRTATTSVYTNTFAFFVMNLIIIAVASTMPVPLGLIVPSFKIGAGLGRFYGEVMAYMFPQGINPYGNRTEFPLLAGAYAVAGSAAFGMSFTFCYLLPLFKRIKSFHELLLHGLFYGFF